jgi:hypothetical protein
MSVYSGPHSTKRRLPRAAHRIIKPQACLARDCALLPSSRSCRRLLPGLGTPIGARPSRAPTPTQTNRAPTGGAPQIKLSQIFANTAPVLGLGFNTLTRTAGACRRGRYSFWGFTNKMGGNRGNEAKCCCVFWCAPALCLRVVGQESS